MLSKFLSEVRELVIYIEHLEVYTKYLDVTAV